MPTLFGGIQNLVWEKFCPVLMLTIDIFALFIRSKIDDELAADGEFALDPQ